MRLSLLGTSNTHCVKTSKLNSSENRPLIREAGKPYFPALDGIRWILVLVVMGFHMTNESVPREDLWIKSYIDGRLAVDTFFIISGFLITFLLLREEKEKGEIQIKKFYLRRVFRLLPVYLFAIVFYIIVGLTVPGQEQQFRRMVDALPYYLTLRNEYLPSEGDFALGHSWSLSVEEKFYIIWPALFFFVFRSRAAKWIPFLLAIALGYFLYESKLYFSYLSILSGCLVAYLLSLDGRVAEFLNRVSSSSVFGWLSLVVLMATYFGVSPWPFPLRFLFTLAFLPFLLHLINGDSALSRGLSTPIMTSMGQKAYAMYLFHMVVVNPMQNRILPPTDTVSYLLCLAISYVLLLFGCTLIFKYFERPFILKGRSLTGG